MKRSRLQKGAGGRKARLQKTIFDGFREKGFLTEGDILLIKRRLNDGKLKADDVFIPDDGWKLTPEQTEKGLNFLMKQWKGKSGAVSKNSPYGYREEDVLANFKEFRLTGFYDTATAEANRIGIHYYQPIYSVISKDGAGFEYVMDFRQAPKSGVYIIG
jgi:hypothetical protein